MSSRRLSKGELNIGEHNMRTTREINYGESVKEINDEESTSEIKDGESVIEINEGKRLEPPMAVLTRETEVAG